MFIFVFSMSLWHFIFSLMPYANDAPLRTDNKSGLINILPDDIISFSSLFGCFFYCLFHIFLIVSKNHRFPLVLILHVQKWLLFAHVNLNSFSFFYSARSVPLPYTSCTMTLSDGIPYRYDGLSYRRTWITEVLYRNGCTVYAPLRQPPPGYGVSSSQSHMVRIRTHRTSCNMQVSACRTWRRRCNPNGELSGECSYGIIH